LLCHSRALSDDVVSGGPVAKIGCKYFYATLLVVLLSVNPAWAVAPSFSGFLPLGGYPGQTVTLNGANLPIGSSYSVLINNVPAAVTSVTSNALTVTVPAGATSSGKVQVDIDGVTDWISTSDFLIVPLQITGVIKDRAEVAIGGARVEVFNAPAFFTTTLEDGSYTLSGLYKGQFSTVGVKVSKTGYQPTYTTPFYTFNKSLDLTAVPNHLYSPDELLGWGITAGKGAIAGHVRKPDTTPYAPVDGAVVSAVTYAGAVVSEVFPVTYSSGQSLGGSSTDSTGFYLVPNLNNSKMVTLSASKSLWGFSGAQLFAYADSVSEFDMLASGFPPYFTGFSPVSGKAGASVILSGSYFSPVMFENLVKFNGTPATVTAASSDSLTVLVPAGATSGPISVTTSGNTAHGPGTFTMHNTLSVSVTGSGAALGTVTSTPSGIFGGISCRPADLLCSAEFEQGTSLTLSATADDGSLLSSWGRNCGGVGGTCSINLDSDRLVSVSFIQPQYLKNGANFYSLLQDAFAGAADAQTIQAQALVFNNAALVFKKPQMRVILDGGLDSSFAAYTGYTTLSGKLELQDGTLQVVNLKIK
jgi:hypothetical protein